MALTAVMAAVIFGQALTGVMIIGLVVIVAGIALIVAGVFLIELGH